MKKPIICIICLREINLIKDSYFKIELYENGKFFGSDYCHKFCFHSRINMENTVAKMIGATQQFMVKSGIMPLQEVEITAI